jgi:Protein of unknown function (DUF2975)
MPNRLITRMSETLIWALITIGLAVQVVVIPDVSNSLAKQYVEYSADAGIITAMLTAIIFVGQATLAFISLLLKRIRANELLSTTTIKWVNALASSLFVASLTFVFLLAWLVSKNTLPPSLAIALMLAVLVSATVALVTLSLKGVLQEATATRVEMDGVI